MHPTGKIISVCNCLIRTSSLLIKNLDKNFHRANEDGCKGFNLLKVLAKVISLLSNQKILMEEMHDFKTSNKYRIIQ